MSLFHNSHFVSIRYIRKQASSLKNSLTYRII